MGMGGAFVTGNSNGAMYHNPAGIHSAPVYSLQTGYQFDDAPNASSLSASIVDAKTNPFIAAGAAYSYTIGNGGSDAAADDLRDHHIRIALAAPLVPRRLSLGIGGQYRNTRAGFDSAEDEALRAKGFALNAGLLGTYEGRVSAGFAAQNIISTGDIDLPRRFIVGAGVFLGPIHAEAQYVTAETAQLTDPEAPNIGLGGGGGSGDKVEYGHGFNVGVEANAGPVPVRIGVGREASTEQMTLGAGFGFRSEVAGFDFGFRQNLASGFGRDRQFSMAVLFFL